MADSELEKNKKRGKRECIMKGLERMEIARERERGGEGGHWGRNNMRKEVFICTHNKN